MTVVALLSVAPVIEADDVGTVFPVAVDRVSTVLKIDDKRTVADPAGEKVDAVEDHLGRPARGGE